MAAATPARCERLTLKVVADTSVSAHPTEVDLNAGAAPRIKLKGIENLVLLAVDPAPLRNRVVVGRATLRLKGADGRLMVRRIGLSTVASAWTEGAGVYAAADGACFLRPGTGKGVKWAGEESTFLDAVFGRGGTIWTRAEAVPRERGWYDIPVDGRLLEACAAGLSFGLALSDDSGQTMNVAKEVDPETNFSNNFFFSREQSGAAPVIEAEADPAPAGTTEELPVYVVPWSSGASVVAGGVEVSWAGPASAVAAAVVLGYRLRVSVNGAPLAALPRWMHPGVPPWGERVRAFVPNVPPGAQVTAEAEIVGRGGGSLAKGLGAGFASASLGPVAPLAAEPGPAALPPTTPPRPAVWAAPDAVKVNPVTGNVLEEPGVEYAGAAAGTWALRNANWEAATSTVSLAALRGEWVGCELVVERRGAPSTDYRVAVSDLRGPGSVPSSSVRLSLARFLRIGDGAANWVPDPLVPLKAGTPFRIPAAPHVLPEQQNQSVHLEIFVPRDAKPGAYAGRVEVRGPSGATSLKLNLEVAAATMPAEAHFVWSLMAYASPGPAAEPATYALAHDHRTTLAVLHYSHSANYDEGCVPAIAGRGPAARVADWSAWDRRFGPLFDGTAFRGTTRPRVPLDHFLLALCEHYPVPMAEGYKWNDLKWEDHWKQAGLIEDGFGPEYRETWVAVAKDYVKHIRSKGWKTSFLVYLNDKYSYKQYDRETKQWGRGVSFWLLDEPQHPDDFLALRFFGELLRRAQGGDRRTVAFRADVSRPQWGRDILDRVVDLQVSGGYPDHRRLLEDVQDRDGQRIWTYGDTPGATETALTLSAWALDLWSHGIDGYIPWLALGEDQNWKEFASTAVIYPGGPAGVPGPCASLRLKAYRRAEQDVEYAWAYAKKHRLLDGDPHRRRVAALLADVLRFGRQPGFLDDEGDRTTALSGVTPTRLESLRRALRAGL